MTGATLEHVSLDFLRHSTEDGSRTHTPQGYQPLKLARLPFRHFCLVRQVGIEPTASTMSLWRSSAELLAYKVAMQFSIRCLPDDERQEDFRTSGGSRTLKVTGFESVAYASSATDVYTSFCQMD